MNLSAALADRLSLVLPAVGMLALLFLGLRRWPGAALALWLISICAIPVWLGVSVGLYWPPAVAVGALALASLMPVSVPRMTSGDMVVALFMLLVVAAVLAGSWRPSAVVAALVTWALAFLLGRVIGLRVDLDWIFGCVAVAFTVVSTAALGEFALSWNPFVQLSASNGLYETWGSLQARGNVIRAEGAFGHSIALGCSIAMAIPIAMSSRFRLLVRIIMVTAMVAATVVTFSRAAIACAALSVILSVIFLRDGLPVRFRVSVAVVFAAIAASLVPVVMETFSAAGEEASNSAQYRLELISLLGQVPLVGVSESLQRSPGGDSSFGGFQSIDSALILIGLDYGWFALALLTLLLAFACSLVARRRASAPTIALVAQIPAFATVALISQYAVLVWFMIGLACFAQANSRLPRQHSPGGCDRGFGPVPAVSELRYDGTDHRVREQKMAAEVGGGAHIGRRQFHNEASSEPPGRDGRAR